MAFLLNKTTIASYFRSHAQKTEDSIYLSRRGFHIEPGTREKALLAEDSALKPFKSYKKSVKQLKRIGDVLTIVVVAVNVLMNILVKQTEMLSLVVAKTFDWASHGCCYEIYVKAAMREEARKQ